MFWPVLSLAATVALVASARMIEPPPVAAPAVAAPAVAAPAPRERHVRRSRKCPDCGWIESKRAIVPASADPAALQVFEYTLRQRDGSSRVFLETLPTSWRLGERVLLIEGTPL
jgi:hypothetical protein